MLPRVLANIKLLCSAFLATLFFNPFPQTLGTACCLRDVAWHPHQHVLALAGYGQDTPVLLYFGEARADKHTKVVVHRVVQI